MKQTLILLQIIFFLISYENSTAQTSNFKAVKGKVDFNDHLREDF